MPASRSALAMTLAPRSWPSRPGLAMTTRVFRPISLNNWLLDVFAPDFPQAVAHLAQGCVGARGFDQQRHRVVARLGSHLESVERPSDESGVASPSYLS